MNHDDDVLASLKTQLARVGRNDVALASGPNGTVTLTANDGAWSGPAAAARIALDKTPDGHGFRSDFWLRFPR